MFFKNIIEKYNNNEWDNSRYEYQYGKGDYKGYEIYDEEFDEYYCEVNLDEDEMYRFIKGDFRECPYYQFGDEYQIVRKQI